MKLEISLKQSTLKLASEIMGAGVDNPNNRVTLANGDQYTLEELFGESVKLELVNEDILKERQDARADSRNVPA